MADSNQHSTQELVEIIDHDLRKGGWVEQDGERWRVNEAGLVALQSLVEQLETARDYERAAVGLSADLSRFGRALQEIVNLDPRLTDDGYERGEDSRYEDDVASIAEAALRGVPERTDEERERYWRQLEQAQADTAAWPQFVKDAFPGSNPATNASEPVEATQGPSTDGNPSSHPGSEASVPASEPSDA